MGNKINNLRFIEVGIAYGDLEFFLSFACSYNLCMRSYDKGSVQKISIDDWLSSDFITSLALRLHLVDFSRLRLVSFGPLSPSLREPMPIYLGNSLPDSWLMPFIHLIAETFLNSYYENNK